MKEINRKDALRGGLLAGLAGLCAVLFSREDKAACNSRCGECAQFTRGKCGLGLR